MSARFQIETMCETEVVYVSDWLAQCRWGEWINKPGVSSFDEGKLRFTTELNTDFWLLTYYGFQRHTGHAFGFHVKGDFTVQVKVMANFSHLYDQAGIFLQDDDNHWVKAGIEFNDGHPSIGCVVTRGISDWSTGFFQTTRKFSGCAPHWKTKR